MKIGILVTGLWYSFINQAKALGSGFRQLGHETKMVQISSTVNQLKELVDWQPDFCIGVGSWHDYPFFVTEPQKCGLTCVPWIVSDEFIDRFIEEYNQLSLILTTSQFCKNVFVRDGLPEERLGIIPEAIDTDVYHVLESAELQGYLSLFSDPDENGLPLPLSSRSLYELREQQVPILLTMGGDATSKGAIETITALAKLDRNLPWLYMIKTWPSVHSFTRSIAELELAEKLGILDRIRYTTGVFSQRFVNILMNLSAFYVSPSRGEGFGLPLVEAQMLGKPVVTIAANATQETVIHEVTGFQATRDMGQKEVRANLDELAHYLGLLIADAGLREKMGQAAMAHARANYSPSVIAAKMLEVLQKGAPAK